jgi:recF protein
VIVQRLGTRNFRNLAPAEYDFHPSANVFVGDNGAGKTNVLEAIYFLATTKSFRTSRTANVISIGETNLFADATIERQGLERTLGIGLQSGEERRRELLVNGQKVTLQTYVPNLQLFAYSAARLEILRGGPDERRRFLDRGIASLKPAYLTELTRYTRVLKQRNALLQNIARGAARETMLEAWDLELLSAAQPIVERRTAYAAAVEARFREIVAAHDYHIRSLTMTYEPSGFETGTPEDLRALRSQRRREIAAGFTLVGPHRDELDFTIAGKAANEILSSGEIKMTVLFLKFAKMILFREETDEIPVFLLDDLDAELDLGIIQRLLLYLSGTTQIFTTSPKNVFLEKLHLGPHRKFNVRAGSVQHAEDRDF